MSSPFLMSLNGTWKLAESSSDETKFPSQFPYDIPVPGLVDLAPGYDWRTSRFHYYACDVDASLMSGREHLDVILGQSMWTTSLWCNGRFAGMSNDCFLPQRFALTPALDPSSQSARIVARIGQVTTLPVRHQAGNDYERLEWIPGIWGDTWLHAYGTYEITGVLTVPGEKLDGCDVRVRVRRASPGKAKARVRVVVRDGAGLQVACEEGWTIALDQNVESEVVLVMRWPSVQMWQPGSPSLYHLTAEVFDEKSDSTEPHDSAERRFGVRRFEVRGRDFLLNGEKIRLRGGNVAFHRLLGDPGRGALPWDLDFARRALCTLPQEHNMNCLRVHIGSMYHRWYDLADEAGILLLEEWPFWNLTASAEDVYGTFTRWIWTLNHHPSIVMWDPGNECELGPVLRTVVPAMTELDSSRAWMHAQADEEHPYHWALIPLHPPRAMGFTRSHEAIRDCERPVSVNEFGWFWLDEQGNVTPLTESVRQRWLPDGLTVQEHLDYQAWLVRECTEVWRRYDVASIQPFVYLSTSRGATANWFDGPLADLKPKPVLKALAEAIAPLGVSWEMNDRHFLPGQTIHARLFVFNDTRESIRVRVKFGLADTARQWLTEPESIEGELDPCSTQTSAQTLKAPTQTGNWRLLACVEGSPTGGVSGVSEKIVDVMPAASATESAASRLWAALDEQGEVSGWLRGCLGATLETCADALESLDTLLVVGQAWKSEAFTRIRPRLAQWLEDGGRLLFLEPDLMLKESCTLELAQGVTLNVTPQFDPEAGGYDTVVIPTPQAPQALLHAMPRLHLGYFNGGIGNIVAGESDVDFGESTERWLVCGLERKRTAVAGRHVGKGLVVASRLQLRGRLMSGEVIDRIEGQQFTRHTDPLAQQLLLNLLSL